ncbi:hypothetical protein [Pseudoalteromonas phage J2-1_QLiu-2017]|nr:hypothetical protein [Pseudoalteromonas phage J2-1_QLiu-2017]
MPAQIMVGNTTNEIQNITLNKRLVYVDVEYIAINDTWVLHLLDSNKRDWYTNIHIRPMMDLTGKYIDFVDAVQGTIICVPTNPSIGIKQPLTKDNFGADKHYQLLFFSLDELDQLTLEE